MNAGSRKQAVPAVKWFLSGEQGERVTRDRRRTTFSLPGCAPLPVVQVIDPDVPGFEKPHNI
jgi:hypothetical protein